MKLEKCHEADLMSEEKCRFKNSKLIKVKTRMELAKMIMVIPLGCVEVP